jgi:prepilin-type N-terminal cleavage/methylation domain-containing protein
LSPTEKRHDGFTLVELLVIIAIIAVLIGLLVPAVQKVREAANRSRCKNNLRQIGLALPMYHQDNNHLPPSRLSDVHATWAILILPYIEQQTLYDQWSLPKTYYDQTDTARRTPVPIYYCPSRRSPQTGPQVSVSGDVFDDPGPGPHTPGALGDYAGSTGTNNCDGADCVGAYNGAFRAAYNQFGKALGYVKFSNVIDGLASTIFVGEKHVPYNQYGQGPLDCSFYNGDYWVCSTRSGGPNFPLATDRFATAPQFGSYHAGICQFLFGDGHVVPISTAIEPKILGLLCDIADGQTIPDY